VGLRLALGRSKRGAAALRGEEVSMRETLHPLIHQLSLALALPLAVTAVWIVRGDPAGVHGTQTATAYRVELADLPLPAPQRLRAPREATDWLGVRRHPEDPIARRRRAALPESAAPQPVELGVEAGPEQARVVAPSPRDGQPQLTATTGAPALAASPPLPVTTPLIVASRAAAVPARIDAPESNGGAAIKAPEPDPDAEAAAGASTALEKTGRARADSDSVRVADGAAVVKIAAGSDVPTRNPMTPSAKTAPAPTRSVAILSALQADHPRSAKPAPGVTAVRASAIPLPEKSSGRNSSGPISSNRISPSHASPSTSSASPSRGAGSVPKREPAKDSHATSERGADWSSIEKGWREELASALPSPALAYATRAASEPVDLSLDRDPWPGSLLHTLLPATSVTALPAEWLAAGDRIADTPTSLVAMARHTLPVLALVSPEVFAGSTDAEDGAAHPAAFSSSRLFPSAFTLLAIPEPGSALLLGAGLAGFAAAGCRVRRG